MRQTEPSRNASPFTVALVLFAIPMAGWAGTFRISSVYSDEGPAMNPAYLRVGVGGIAVYRGPLDPNDNGWLLQTFLNDSLGWDIDDWGNPDWWSDPGLSGSTIPYSGYEIVCDPLQCGAVGAIKKCDAVLSPLAYKGRAGVAIYHQYSPEIDEGFTRVEETECVPRTVGGKAFGLLDESKLWDLEMDLNGVEKLSVSSFAFEFLAELRDGDAYSVSVSRDPWGQHCAVASGGAGIIDGENITDVVVDCQDHCYSVSEVVPAPADADAAMANCNTPLLVDQGGGTVADVSNNLLWTRDVVHYGCIGAEYYSGAFLACSELALGGRTDWRLPDIAQLSTLTPFCGPSGNALSDCEGLFWSRSSPPALDCCPRGYGCGRCHWVGAFGSEAGSLEYGNVEWWDIDVRCVAKTRCVVDLFLQ